MNARIQLDVVGNEAHAIDGDGQDVEHVVDGARQREEVLAVDRGEDEEPDREREN